MKLSSGSHEEVVEYMRCEDEVLAHKALGKRDGTTGVA